MVENKNARSCVVMKKQIMVNKRILAALFVVRRPKTKWLWNGALECLPVQMGAGHACKNIVFMQMNERQTCPKGNAGRLV